MQSLLYTYCYVIDDGAYDIPASATVSGSDSFLVIQAVWGGLVNLPHGDIWAGAGVSTFRVVDVL
jgi:hypothetical protein